MRRVSLVALLASSLSLGACSGGGGGSAFDAAFAEMALCGLACDPATSGGGTSGGGTSGGGTTGGGTTGGGTTGTGSSGGGNTTTLTPVSGSRTIALEASKLVKPSTGTSLASLSTTTLTSTAANSNAVTSILSATKPTQLKVAIDTQATGNNLWAVPILMDEYVTGTTGGDPFNALLSNQRMGSGTGYREYRALSAQDSRDELLQVWAFDESYALQYRNASGGGDAKHQAWSFGGNATSTMLTSGSGTYAGRFAATAKTENWLNPDGSDVDPNALWMLQGATNMTANFGTGAVNGTLTPETWTSYQSKFGGYYAWYTPSYSGGLGAPSVASTSEPEFQFYGTTIGISATIDQTTGPTPANSANFTGTARLDSGFVSGDNPVYGGFFGNGANEVAGVFNVYGVLPSPKGGSIGINDDRRGFLTINGAFQGNCTGGACTP